MRQESKRTRNDPKKGAVMTVGQLIALLQKLPSHLPVCYGDTEPPPKGVNIADWCYNRWQDCPEIKAVEACELEGNDIVVFLYPTEI
jgi:hypothetical protein